VWEPLGATWGQEPLLRPGLEISVGLVPPETPRDHLRPGLAAAGSFSRRPAQRVGGGGEICLVKGVLGVR